MRSGYDIIGIFFGLFFMISSLCLLGFRQTSLDKNMMCQDNLRKLHGYMIAYQNDHGEVPPITIPMEPLWKFWDSCLEPYSGSKMDFVCPEDPRTAHMFKPENPLITKTRKSSCYGMNWYISTPYALHAGFKKANLEHIKNTKQIVLLGDARSPYFIVPSMWDQCKDFRHEYCKANFVFVDGHTEDLTEDKLVIMQGEKLEARSEKWYWN